MLKNKAGRILVKSGIGPAPFGQLLSNVLIRKLLLSGELNERMVSMSTRVPPKIPERSPKKSESGILTISLEI